MEHLNFHLILIPGLISYFTAMHPPLLGKRGSGVSQAINSKNILTLLCGPEHAHNNQYISQCP